MGVNGFEKYTYRLADGTTRTVENIPTAEINKMRREHNITHSEAVIAWINGETPVSKECQKKTRKAPTRQPDEVKRTMIEKLAEFVAEYEKISDVEVVNAERVISFKIDTDTFELTLSKKRAKK